MAALWRLAQLALMAEAEVWRSHARRRVGLLLALAGLAVLALGFALALGVVALSIRLGMLGALAVALGVAILGCLIVLILLQLEGRAHARRAAAQAAERKRLLEIGLISLLPGLKAGTAVAVGLAALALVLLSGKGKDGD
ncbi:MAG: hypothetical protein GC186_05135 [Rhodobacteraceae bacterium]|nr:hypothetical protein [Paracoccaceae bacterium]